MSEFKCLVCKSPYFKEGYDEIDTEVDAYPYNKSDLEIGTNSNSDISFRIRSGDKFYDDFVDVYKYVCEDCGYIMSFTKEKEMKSRKQKKEQQKKESSYDWSNFGKGK